MGGCSLKIALGTGSLTTSGFKLDQCLDTALDLGFEFIDLWMERENFWPPSLKEGKRSKIIEGILDRGLKVISTCPIIFKTEDWVEFHYEYNLADPDEDKRKSAVEFIMSCMDISKDLGSQTMLILPGKIYQPDLTKSKIQYRKYFCQAIKSLNECGDYASKLDLDLGVENAVIGNFGYNPYELYKLTSEVESNRVKAYLDTANANVIFPPVDYVRILNGRLANCIHISDNDGLSPSHLPIGMGEIDFKELLSELKNLHWEGYLVLEVFYKQDPIGGLKTSKEELENLLKEI
jgi:deoxyribonuclease-4